MDDHATTRVDPRVTAAMAPFFDEVYGNPANRLTVHGRLAAQAVNESREQVAALLGARDASDVVFTSGATESNNLAILGIADGRNATQGHAHFITVATEHSSVLGPHNELERQGVRVTRLGVDGIGRVDPEAVKQAITPDTALISVMLCNNEVGTLQPIRAIGEIARSAGVLFHCDATQGLGRVAFSVEEDSVDLASLSAHKLYGPKGVGALYVGPRAKLKLRARAFGGGHEGGLRPGTLNVPGVVGLGHAAYLLRKEGAEETKRISSLRRQLITHLSTGLGNDLQVHGGGEAERHPGNLHVSFRGVDGDALFLGIADSITVSSGAACATAARAASHVLAAMGVPVELARASLRFGLGRFSTHDQVYQAAACVIQCVRSLREGSEAAKLAALGVDPDKVQW